MAVRFLHPGQDNSLYFVTFTCHPHSSASFYETGQGGYARLLHAGEIIR